MTWITTEDTMKNTTPDKDKPLAIGITENGVAFFTPSFFGIRTCFAIRGYTPEPTPPEGPYHGGTGQRIPTVKKKDNPFKLAVSNIYPLKAA